LKTYKNVVVVVGKKGHYYEEAVIHLPVDLMADNLLLK
jgi:hypothetical protein